MKRIASYWTDNGFRIFACYAAAIVWMIILMWFGRPAFLSDVLFFALLLILDYAYYERKRWSNPLARSLGASSWKSFPGMYALGVGLVDGAYRRQAQLEIFGFLLVSFGASLLCSAHLERWPWRISLSIAGLIYGIIALAWQYRAGKRTLKRVHMNRIH